ncbi:MAG: dihydrofolate reductase family protein [bacterium]|nr:dihydrofolate reductase family protein [bacterium]
MRKLIISTMVTLDGVMENPQDWSFPYWSDEIGRYAYEQLFSTEALLMGRATYEGFSQAWAERAGTDEFADRMNSLPKYVASTTLQDTTWNASVIQGDVAEAVKQLKQQPGQNILKYGGGQLLRTLMEHDLVDEHRLLVYPVVVGSGERIFDQAGLTGMASLKLIETKPFSSGVVALHYAPAREAASQG